MFWLREYRERLEKAEPIDPVSLDELLRQSHWVVCWRAWRRPKRVNAPVLFCSPKRIIGPDPTDPGQLRSIILAVGRRPTLVRFHTGRVYRLIGEQ